MNQFEFDADLRRHEALLEMADLVVRYHSLPELFPALAERLLEVAAADATHFALYDPVKERHDWPLVGEKWPHPF